MNERIRELSKQAWEWAEQQEYNDPAQEFSDILEQKFAELLIRECARISVEADDTMTNQGEASAQAFMEHFGVEE